MVTRTLLVLMVMLGVGLVNGEDGASFPGLQAIVKRMEDLESTNHNLETTTREQNSKIEKLSSQFNTLTNSMTGVQQCTGSRVAFTAGLTSGGTVPAHQIVKYNLQIINIGNAYSSATGIFTCTVAGLYGFTVNLQTSAAGQPACMAIKRNSGWVTDTTARDNNYKASTSQSVTLHLDLGDTVSVAPWCASYLETSSVPSNTFSGVLLSADTCL